MTYHTLGKFDGDPQPEPGAMAMRDLLSSTETLLLISDNDSNPQINFEIDALELAHARLSKIIQRIARATDIL